MRLITAGIAFAIWALALTSLNAQENQESQSKLEILKNTREQVITAEKEELKQEVEAIEKRLQDGEIIEAEAESLKIEAAQKRALNIENKLAIIDNKIALVERNGEGELLEDGNGATQLAIGFGKPDKNGSFLLGVNVKSGRDLNKEKRSRRTIGSTVFSFGLNNVLIDGQSLDDSPYKVGGSRYAELGYSWSTRVFDDSNWLRFKYGFSFQFNGLKPTDNRYLVDTGSQTELQEFPLDLKKSKFRMDNLVIPVFLEFGPSKKIEKNGITRFKQHNLFKVGIGGYAGVNLGSRQKLRFKEDGETVSQKLKANYNTNNFVYGVSGYIGWSDLSLYAKYDLNPIFKNNSPEQRNISLGLRWDWD